MILVFVLVLVVVLAILGAAHWYVWRRLVRDTTVARSRWRRAGNAVFIAGPILAVGALAGEQAGLPHAAARVVAWPGYLWLALLIYLFLGVVVGEVVRPLLSGWLARRSPVAASQGVAMPSGTEPVDLVSETDGPSGVSEESVRVSRRVFVSRVVGGAAAAVAVGTVGAGTVGVLNGPSVKRITVPLAKLPRSAHGLRIAVVSDVHLGPILGSGFCRRVVETINGTQPDLIAVVGDLIDGDVEDLASSVEPLRGLQSRLGTFFVTGNHEYISGVEPWVTKVRELGMQPLRNSRIELPGFDLAGVDDLAGEDDGAGPDFGAALGDRDRSRAVVLMAHQPVNIYDAVDHGVDLQLSGHTHGGQLWPGNYIAEMANPTNAGLEKYGDTQLYVSRGAGAWGPPVRVGAPSDITIVELASGAA
ncbi:metallophosphoesterase [Actinoplanes sp. CA-015351]|uniref:metallophosphoesterase n=1 Tax=Actinoplanes sp. CA-015351 TaxID=3239897 RepID=UPI003D9927D9